MKFDFQVESATFCARPNRFLVEARLTRTGEMIQVHCPDPGRLQELLLPGATVYVSPATGLNRKTSWVLRFVIHPDPQAKGQLISLDSRLPNQLVGEALAAGTIGPLRGYVRICREVSVPEAVAGAGVRSRIDYLLEDGPGLPPCWVEVKSVTLVEDGRALFPDAVTARGRRHILELAHLHQLTGARTAVLFIIQRPDVQSFAPQVARDPMFAQALRDAHTAGVEIYAYRCHLTLHEITLGAPVPVELT